MKTIHGTLTTSVTLGIGGYGRALAIATDGAIIPTEASANAIFAAATVTNARVVNDGTLRGADGLSVTGQNQNGGNGGVGILLSGSGTILSSGVVAGGNGGTSAGGLGGYGGAGVFIGAAGAVANSGTINGGQGALGDAHLRFGTGGVGVDLAQGGVLNNQGMIHGGSGGYQGNSPPDNGVGVALGRAGTVMNGGSIQGGQIHTGVQGVGAVGAGMDFSAGGTLINRGTVTGGYEGGNGVRFAGEGQIKNFGTISGGDGFFDDENGGTGVLLSGGGTLTNSGAIAGGPGGDGYHDAGGAGVFINGGMLIASSGTISGGLGGDGQSPRLDGPAVQFGAAAGTLVIDPAAKFVGDIVANPAVNDTLVLAGSTAGTLSGVGKQQVTGFTTITETAHATWTLQGVVTGVGTLALGNGAHLELAGAVSIATVQFKAGPQALQLDKPHSVTSTFAGFGKGDSIDLVTIKAASLQYAEGTLTLLNAQGSSVDTLLFAGNYTAADFALHDLGTGTELDYAATAASFHGAGAVAETHAVPLWDGADRFMYDWHALLQRE